MSNTKLKAAAREMAQRHSNDPIRNAVLALKAGYEGDKTMYDQGMVEHAETLTSAYDELLTMMRLNNARKVALRGLLEWASYTGGWDSPAWQLARACVKDAAPKKPAAITPEGFVACGYCDEPGFPANDLETDMDFNTTAQQWQCYACGCWNDRTPQEASPAPVDISHVIMETSIILYYGMGPGEGDEIGGAEVMDWDGTLGAFLEENDGLDDREILAIWDRLHENGSSVYLGGGGAAPAFRLVLANRPAAADDDDDDDCSDPEGHRWVEGAPDRGDEGPIRCANCGDDGDA